MFLMQFSVLFLIICLTFLIAWLFGLFSFPKTKGILCGPFAAIGGFLLFFLIQMSLILIFATLSAITHFYENSSNVQFIGWIQFIATTTATLALLGFIRKLGLRGIPIWGDITLSRALIGASTLLIALPLVLAISQLVGSLLIHFEIKGELIEQTPVKYIKKLMEFPLLFSFTVFEVVVIIPIAEEVLFRGLLQSWLKKYVHRIYAIGLSSIIFACFHYSSEQQLSNVVILPSLFAFSIILGSLYEKQQSLISPIVLHSLFNLSSTILIFLATESS
ncbi:MAG: hypothetical protein Tsb0021_06620 [Chlamydiales bacterium]